MLRMKLSVLPHSPILRKSACMSARWSWKALWWKGPWPVLSQHIPNPGMWEDSGHKSLGENCRLSKKGQAVTNELIIDLVSFSHLWITQWCTCCLQRVVQTVLTKICASWLCWFLCLERKRAVGIIKQHHHKHHSMLYWGIMAKNTAKVNCGFCLFVLFLLFTLFCYYCCFVVLIGVCFYNGPLGKKKQRAEGTMGPKALSLFTIFCPKVNRSCHCETGHSGLWVCVVQVEMTTPELHCARSCHPLVSTSFVLSDCTGSLGWWHVNFADALSLLWFMPQHCLTNSFSAQLRIWTWVQRVEMRLVCCY